MRTVMAMTPQTPRFFSLSLSLSPESPAPSCPPVEAQSEWRFVLPHLSGDIVTSSQLITEAVPRGIQHDATYTTQGLGSQELHLRAKGSCLSEVPLFTHKKKMERRICYIFGRSQVYFLAVGNSQDMCQAVRHSEDGTCAISKG